ncbi:MAG: Lipopolysaccharide ABC transporter, ATP-binding protein LptB, partial [uncultured Acetobacteraceae bacterium]
ELPNGPRGPHAARRPRRGRAVGQRPRQALPQAAGGAERVHQPPARRGGGAARPQRRRQDHHLLHDHRLGAARRGHGDHGRARRDPPSHVPARPPRPGLPAAGGLDLSGPQRGRQHTGRARSGGTRARPAGADARLAAGGVRHLPPAAGARPGALRRRAAALRDRPRLGHSPFLHPFGRTSGRHRSDRGGRDPRFGQAPQGQRHRRAHHRPQRSGNAGDHRPRLHPPRGAGADGRGAARHRGARRGPPRLSRRAVQPV